MDTDKKAATYLMKISMAVRPKDWGRITRAHGDEGVKTVSDAEHLTRYPAPESFRKMVDSPEQHATSKEKLNGVSRKLVHEVPDSVNPELTHRFMTKAYHATPEKRAWAKFPIMGWATITTKAMFDAAGLKDNVERVSTHRINDIPTTVHELSPGYQTANGVGFQYANQGRPSIPRDFDAAQVYRIATLDYLAGNNDRHGENIMIDDETDQRGVNNLLAIDHERNFQYVKPVKNVRNHLQAKNLSDTPSDFVINSALAPMARQNGNYHDLEDFVEWWRTHRGAIVAAFKDNLEHIQDKRLKEHIERNFNHRVDVIDRWASDDNENGHQAYDLFDSRAPIRSQIIPMPRAPFQKLDSILKGLPAEPMAAIEQLMSLSEKRKDQKGQEKILQIFEKYLTQLSSEQVLALYEKTRKHPAHYAVGGQGVAFQLLSYIGRVSMNRSLAKQFLEKDQDSGWLPVFWANLFKDLVGEKK